MEINAMQLVEKPRPIEIDGKPVTMVCHSGKFYVIVRGVCEMLGLDPKTQSRKIQRVGSKWNWGLMTSVARNGSTREMLALEAEQVAAWLNEIDIADVGAASISLVPSFDRNKFLAGIKTRR